MITIKKLQEADIDRVVGIFGSIVDELHPKATDEVKSQYRSTYSRERLNADLKDKRRVHLVLREDDRIAGFIFGWAKLGVGNIHWFGVDTALRGKGYGKLLLEGAVSEFEKRGCYQAELFTYPEFKNALQLFKGLGFKEKSLIEKDFFGISVVYLIKDLIKVSEEDKIKKIVLVGTAGQGIKLIAEVLADILAKLDKEVSLNISYGPAVRSGEVEAELIFSENKIGVPFIERPDILLMLSKADVSQYKAKEVILETSIEDMGAAMAWDIEAPETERVSFIKIAQETFGSPRFINMIALGRLLSHIGINIEKVNLRSELPPQFLKENIDAVLYGYIYTDYSGKGGSIGLR